MESTYFIPSDKEDVAIDETMHVGFWVQRIRPWSLGSCVWPEPCLLTFVNRDHYGL